MSTYKTIYNGGFYTIDTAILYGIVGAFDDLLNPLHVTYTLKELMNIFYRCTLDARLHCVVVKVAKLLKTTKNKELENKNLSIDNIIDKKILVEIIKYGTSDIVDLCIEVFPDIINYTGVLDGALEAGRYYSIERLLKLGVHPNTINFRNLKLDKFVGPAIDCTTLQQLIDHGLNVMNDELYIHCIKNNSCMNLLIHKYGVDVTKIKLMTMSSYKDFTDFLDSYPDKDIYNKIHNNMNATVLIHLLMQSVKSDLVLYIMRHILPLELRKNFTKILKYAYVRAVYDELFALTGLFLPDYENYMLDPPPLEKDKPLKAKWLKLLAKRMKNKREVDKRSRMRAIGAKIAIDHFVEAHNIPHHLAEIIGCMSLCTARDKMYYDAICIKD